MGACVVVVKPTTTAQTRSAPRLPVSPHDARRLVADLALHDTTDAHLTAFAPPPASQRPPVPAQPSTPLLLPPAMLPPRRCICRGPNGRCIHSVSESDPYYCAGCGVSDETDACGCLCSGCGVHDYNTETDLEAAVHRPLPRPVSTSVSLLLPTAPQQPPSLLRVPPLASTPNVPVSPSPRSGAAPRYCSCGLHGVRCIFLAIPGKFGLCDNCTPGWGPIPCGCLCAACDEHDYSTDSVLTTADAAMRPPVL